MALIKPLRYKLPHLFMLSPRADDASYEDQGMHHDAYFHLLFLLA
jgi:hypothetical protein